VPSLRRTASPESFHPWLDRPWPERSTYSRSPSPSASPCSTCQASARSRAGSSRSTSSPGAPQLHAVAVGAVVLAEAEAGRAHLVQDLAGLLGGHVVGAGALVVREEPQGGHRQVRGDRHQHARGPEAVAAEQGEEPRRAGTDELLVHAVATGRREAQQPEVVEAAPQDRGEAAVGAVDLDLGPARVAARGRDRRGGRVQGQQQVVGDALARGHDDVPRHHHVRAVRARAGARDAQAGAQAVAVPGQHRAADPVGGDRLEGRAGLHAVHRGEVGGHPQAQGAGDRLGRGARQHVGLAHQAGLDVAPPDQAHRRVGPGVPEVPGNRHERVGVAADAVGRDGRGLATVDLERQQADHPVVGVVDAGQAAGADLAVTGRPHLRRRREREGQVVQPGLFHRRSFGV
jgi:hypothetical protein